REDHASTYLTGRMAPRPGQCPLICLPFHPPYNSALIRLLQDLPMLGAAAALAAPALGRRCRRCSPALGWCPPEDGVEAAHRTTARTTDVGERAVPNGHR